LFASTEWENLTLAGAFIFGAALGTIATIRVMRAVFGYVRPNLFRGATKPPPADADDGSVGDS
jgi:hypothetical protein